MFYDYLYDFNEDFDLYDDILDEETSVIGKVLGKPQNDKRDPGEVLAYNRHQNLAGNILGGPVFSWIASHNKEKNPNKLYNKYLIWCDKKGIKPTSRKEFNMISSKYYKERKKDKMVSSFVPSPISQTYNLVRSADRNEKVLNSIKKEAYEQGYLDCLDQFLNE